MDFGVIVDLETTGLSPEKDAIIEIGILEFCLEEGSKPAITSMYSCTEEPDAPITKEIEKITGLSHQVLKGTKIDWELVRRMLSKASILIAHNAQFDAGFLRRRPELKGSNFHWGCSVEHVDWRAHGYKSRSLNYLAADHGFVNPFAHRALFDCATTFRVVAPHIDELIERSYERRFTIYAVGSPFESKELLKQRGYRWDGEKRSWHRNIFETELEAERSFLAEKIYAGAPQHQELEVQGLS